MFIIKNFLKKLFFHNRIIKWIFVFIFHNELIEHKCSFGSKNPEKQFVVLRGGYNSGLIALFLGIIDSVYRFEKKGYVPVVDFKNYSITQYSNGVDNTWEWFFSQPQREYKLEDVRKSKNVLLAGVTLKESNPSDSLFYNFCLDSAAPDDIHRISQFVFSRIQVNNRIKEMADNEMRRIPVENCIGVLARGTDYTVLKPVGEPIQPSFEQIVQVINELKEKYNNPPLFLVTEDSTIKEKMQKKYPDVFTISDDYTYDSSIWNGKSYLSSIKLSSTDKKNQTEIYLKKLILLSMCKYLIAGKCSGTTFSILLNDNHYHDKYIFNLGYYGK